jgi:hypothetical protein
MDFPCVVALKNTRYSKWRDAVDRTRGQLENSKLPSDATTAL